MKSTPTIIDTLNGLLRLELGAISQYVVHHSMAENWAYTKLAERTMKRAREEMEHASKLIDRILVLDGVPIVTQLGPITIGAEVSVQHADDLASENLAIAAYRAAIGVAASEQDHGTRVLLDEILVDEEGHASDLEAELDQLTQMGVAVYLGDQV